MSCTNVQGVSALPPMTLSLVNSHHVAYLDGSELILVQRHIAFLGSRHFHQSYPDSPFHLDLIGPHC